MKKHNLPAGLGNQNKNIQFTRIPCKLGMIVISMSLYEKSTETNCLDSEMGNQVI
jgi:hypothetical protein